MITIEFKFDILQRHLKQQSLHKAAPEMIKNMYKIKHIISD